jgi:hypothetical protein
MRMNDDNADADGDDDTLLVIIPFLIIVMKHD